MSRMLITWQDGAYYVNRPNYDGGEVVEAAIADELREVLVVLYEAYGVPPAMKARVEAAIEKAKQP